MDTKVALDTISDNTGIPRDKAAKMLSALADIIGDECAQLDSIAIPGFGTFEARKKLERVAVHPSTGKRMLVPPKISLYFRPSALLKQKVKNV